MVYWTSQLWDGTPGAMRKLHTESPHFVLLQKKEQSDKKTQWLCRFLPPTANPRVRPVDKTMVQALRPSGQASPNTSGARSCPRPVGSEVGQPARLSRPRRSPDLVSFTICIRPSGLPCIHLQEDFVGRGWAGWEWECIFEPPWALGAQQ